MLFRDGKSALVRLSDCIKFGVGNSLSTTTELLAMQAAHAPQIARLREIALQLQSGRLSTEEAEALLQRGDAQIPGEKAQIGVRLQGRLHSEVLATILNVCFALESYINTLGFHLLRERDILGLIANSNPSTIDAFIEAIDRMSPVAKWQTIGKLKSEDGFDAGKSPLQDMKILFLFRNDHVHDKVVDYDEQHSKKRYNDRLPDPVSGLLELEHAVYACDCYWSMITRIHVLIGVSISEFHQHYNLTPWFDAEFEKKVRSVSAEYRNLKNHTTQN